MITFQIQVEIGLEKIPNSLIKVLNYEWKYSAFSKKIKQWKLMQP